MRLSNGLIYKYAQNLNTFFIDAKIPVKINFYLQKNIQLIQQSAEEIERVRLGIGAQLGSINLAQNGYDIPPENINEANKELQDLFNLEQDIPIHIFKLSDFENIELTYQQLSAIMFMIEE